MTGGDHEPRKANYIALCRSTDRGRSWSKKQTVLRFPDRAALLSEAYVHGGEVRVFVQTHGGYFEDWRDFLLVSRDNGRTWADPVPFEPLPRRAFIRNRYVASWGEWFLPLQTYDTMPDPAPSPLKDGSHRRAFNGTLISRDEGKTWAKSNQVGPTAGWAENNVVELRDGRMVMLIRADGKGHLLRSESQDRGRTWSPPRRTDIPNPGSKFRLHRLSTGRIVLVHNPSPKPGVRNPLALWASDDDLASWPHRRVLIDFPGQLQYPDGFVDEAAGYVHFAFDYNRHDLIYVGARLPA
jgi:predicted neuraminidase